MPQNIEKAKQLDVIVCKIIRLDSNLQIIENIELQNELKWRWSFYSEIRWSI